MSDASVIPQDEITHPLATEPGWASSEGDSQSLTMARRHEHRIVGRVKLIPSCSSRALLREAPISNKNAQQRKKY